jgi:DNA repair protein RecO (recombination protein O)
MEQTFNTRAIILSRHDFREDDSRIILFSEEKGKMSLVVRGAKKMKSKLSGHVEPLTLSRLMVVKGKDFDYVGSAKGENFYQEIKENLDKVFVAGQALTLVDKMTREGEVDGQGEVFELLESFLDELGTTKELLPGISRISIFSEDLASILGFSHDDFEELKRK